MNRQRNWFSLGLIVAAAWGLRLILSAAGNGSPLGDAELRAMASTVKSDQILMYSTSNCLYCQQAKVWLQTYGFTWSECNMSVESRCEPEFRAWGARGTPFFVITQGSEKHPMYGGLDKARLVQLLGR